MGHTQVFTHVGDAVKIQAPNGKMVSPLITGELVLPCFVHIYYIAVVPGTFGSSDFIHSLLGGASLLPSITCTIFDLVHDQLLEATDHLVRLLSGNHIHLTHVLNISERGLFRRPRQISLFNVPYFYRPLSLTSI
jgi:hypothetical protein